jgi:hypothetical protein
MHWRDHAPPHFHAKYQDQEITVEIGTGIVTGHMGPKAVALIQEWRREHQAELLADWNLAEQRRSVNSIPPLE